MNIIKTENGGKIDSHYWTMRGIASYLNPKYMCFIDMGTIPKKDSVRKLTMYMEINQKCGGCCGEIEVFKPYARELEA